MFLILSLVKFFYIPVLDNQKIVPGFNGIQGKKKSEHKTISNTIIVLYICSWLTVP